VRKQSVPDFAAFVAAKSDAHARTAYLLTGNTASAEDLVQTVLASLYRRWHRIDHDGGIDAYVYRAMLNTWLSWRYRMLRRETPVAEVPDTTSHDPIAAVSTRQDLVDALNRLPPRQRAAVILRYFNDLTEVQAAELLTCSVGTVKSQTSRALAALRSDLSLAPCDTAGDGTRHGLR